MYAHVTRSTPRRSSQQLAGLAVAVMLVLLVALTVVVWRQQQFTVLSVQSASMTPFLQPGDAVLVRRVAPERLRIGDVVSYNRRTAEGKSLRVTHRIVAINAGTHRFVTQGDDNATADPSVGATQIIGRAEHRLANAGYVVDFLRSPKGLVVIMYAPALIVVTIELRRLTHYFKPSYRHYSWQ